jgi:hypothetical protein
MAVSQAEQIQQYLQDIFNAAEYGPKAQEYLDDLDKFDSFHDFGNQTEMKAKDAYCCSHILNDLVGARPNMGFLASRGIKAIYKGELIRIKDWSGSIENQIKQRYQRLIPNLLQISTPDEGIEIPNTLISYTQILENPEALRDIRFSSIKIYADVDLNDEQKVIVGNAILNYMFGIPERPQGIFFTHDASVNITKDLFTNFNNVTEPGFFVGQLITPQNVCDSATTSTNEGVYKDKAFNENILVVGEGTNNSRVRYLFNLEDNTSNYFSRAFTNFKIKNIEGRPFTAQTPYSLNYSITLKTDDAAAVPAAGEQDVSIKFNTDDTYKKGKAGPSVSYLKALIANLRIDDTTCTDVRGLLDKIREIYGDEYNNRKNMVLFDIKRSGDHEQANALWIFNNTEHNIHYGVFQTLDILSALYSRILGNPTVFTSTSKYMELYKGLPKMPIDPLDLDKYKLAVLLSYVNRIIGIYFSLITVYDAAPMTQLISDLNTRENFVNKDDFVKYCVMIKAADAVYTIQNIRNKLVYNFNNNANNANNANIINKIKENIKFIYGAFGHEINEDNILEGFNIIMPDWDTLSQKSTQLYIQLLQDFVDTTRDSYQLCESYLQNLNNKKIVTSENGIITSLNIQTQFFVDSANGQKNSYVNKNDTIGFNKDQIKTDNIFSNRPNSREIVRGKLLEFISSLMSKDMYLTKEPFVSLFANIEHQHSAIKKTYKKQVIDNFCVPFLNEIERLITLQSGGAHNNNKDGDIFYDLVNKTTDVIHTIATKDNAAKDFDIITHSDLKNYKLITVYNENCQKSTPISNQEQYTIISDALFKINAMIRSYSAVEYFTEQDINIMGGSLWIAQTFINVAQEFINMYLELEIERLEISMQENLTNFYTYIFLPLSLKFQSMYNTAYDNFNVNLSAFSNEDILKMKLTLQVFGTRLQSGVDYSSKDVINIIKHITSQFRLLSRHNVNSRTTSIFGGRKKTQRRRSKGKTKSKITKVRRNTQYLKKKNK